MVHYLSRGEKNPVTPVTEKYATVLRHIAAIHAFYGENQGVKMARKHVAWYSQHLHLPEGWRRDFNHIQLASQQLAELEKIMTTDNSKCKGTAEAMAA